MRYLGGKQKIGKHIAKYILDNYQFNVYTEPFCGMLGVMRHIPATYQRVANDSHTLLIDMLQCVQQGWLPPLSDCSESLYNEMKFTTIIPTDKQDRAHYAFVGHACAFGGRWFSGFARDSRRGNYYMNGKRGLQKLYPVLRDILFTSHSYNDFLSLDNPLLSSNNNVLIYCDPPYSGIQRVGTREKFNNLEFWEWARKLSRLPNVVLLISEISAPDDFECVWQLERTRDCRAKSSKTITERLYKYKGQSNE